MYSECAQALGRWSPPIGRAPSPHRRIPARSPIAVLAWLAILAALISAPIAGDDIQLVEPLSVAKDHGETAHFVEERRHIPIFEVVGSFDRGTPAETAAPRAAVAREFFSRYEDRYDALLVFSTFEFDTGEALAFHLGVRNDVEGLGKQIFDNSAAFGSDSVLASYIDMASVDRYNLNPVSRHYEKVLNAAAHEILHRWCCQLLTEGANPTALLGQMQSHWSAGLDSDASVMYGSEWRANADGTFTAVAVRKVYSALDLYTSGFARADEVDDLLLLESPDLDPEALPELGQTIAATSQVIPMADVVSANGPRVPSADDADREFRAAVVLIRRPGDVVEDDLLTQLDVFRHQLSSRFTIHTGGRGRLEVVPTVISDAAPGEPTAVDPGTPGGGVSLAQGLIWLRSRQQADGSWQDVVGTRWRDTSEALYTLGLLDPTFTGTQSAIDALAALVPASVDDQARSLRALSAASVDASPRLPGLLGLRNDDGGWGLGAGTGSSPLDTALAVQALSELLRLDPSQSQIPPLVDAAAQHLEASRGAGGWSPGDGGANRVQPTAEALQALAVAGVPATGLADAVAWVVSQQNADGGFGDSPSTPQATAQVLLALSALGALDAIDRDAALAYLESQQADEGSWRGSVYVTSLALRALRGARFANWRFDGPAQVVPATPRDGERLELTHRIVNHGQLPTPAGALALFLGDPAAGGVEADRVDLPALQPGAAIFATSVWDTLDQAGVHTLFAVLDPDDALEEVSELDNQAATEIEVLPAPVGADLEISADEILVDPAQPAELPASLSFSAVVRNFGQTDAVDVRVVLWRGDPVAGSVADETAVSVAARSSAPVSFVDVLSEPGEQLYTIQADADDAISEDDETNNSAQATVGTLAGLDLAVDAADVAVTGPTLLGRDVSLDAVVRNRGTVDSPSFVVRASVYDAADGPSGGVEVASFDTDIAAGQSRSFSWVWRVDRIGDLVFAVELDPAGVVLETDETNNLASHDFTSTADTGSNLSLSFEDLEFLPQPANEGETVDLVAHVRNTGAADLADVVIAFFDGDPAASGVEIGRATLPSHLAGAVGDAQLAWSGWSGSADRTIHVAVDPDDAVAETDETDNAAFGVLEVLSRPNLAISQSSVRVVPAFPAPGEAVTLEADIANLGEQDAGPFVVRFRSGGTDLGDVVVAGLSAGQSMTASLPWTAPSEPAVVEVLLDADDAVIEGSETDNRAEISLVPLADEGVAPEYISPDGDGVQDTATFFHGEVPGQTLDIAIYAESDGRLVRTDTSTGAAFEWDGKGSQGALQGAVVPDGTYRLVASAGGTTAAQGHVTVDNNRSPLFATEGSGFARIRNLTCDAREVSNHQVAEGDTLSYYVDFGTNSILYRRPLGGAAEQIHRSRGFDKYDLSDDGQWRVRGWPVVLERSNGSGTQPIANVRDFGFVPGTHDLLVYHSNGELWIRPAGNPAADRHVATPGQWVPIVAAYDEAWSDPRYQSFSPDGRLLVAYDYNFSTADDLSLIDLQTGTRVDLMQSHPDLDDLWVNAHVWSPNGNRLAVIFEGEPLAASTESTQLVLAVFDRQGNRLAFEIYRRTFLADLPYGAVLGLGAPGGGATMYYWEHSIPVFDATGDRVFFSTATEDVANYRAYHGALMEFDVAGGEFRRLKELAPVVYFPFVYHGEADGEYLPLFHQLAPSLTGGGDLFLNAEFDLDINDVDIYEPGNWRVDPDGGAAERVLEDFDFFFDPLFDSGGRRFFFRDNRDIEDPETECHRPGLEIPPYESLAIFSGKAGQDDAVEQHSSEAQELPRFEDGLPSAPTAAERRAAHRARHARTDEESGTADDVAKTSLDKGFGPSDYRHHTSFFLFDSLANLTAELEAAPAAGGVGWVLKGTVSDLHLAGWQLEWQDEAVPGFWLPLASGTSAVSDDTLAVWSPPHAGTFRVRLTARDRAGNSRSTQRLLSAGDGNLPAVTSASLDPRVFSPNGDGLADTTLLRYEVASPVNLQIRIVDSSGRQILSVSRSHAAAGSFDLTWDGRDQVGVPVPAGSYEFEILHFRLTAVVDLEAPQSVLFRPEPLRDDGPFVEFVTALRWCADDDSGVVDGGEIETGPAPAPATWDEFRALGPLDVCPMAEHALSPSEFVHQAFRLTVTDRAQNVSRLESAYGPEQMVAHGFGAGPTELLAIPTDRPLAASPEGIHHILVGETVRSALAAVSVQVQIEGQSTWREDPVDDVLTSTGGVSGPIPDHGFQVVWSGPLPAGIHTVRVRGIDTAGDEFLSNAFRVESAGSGGNALRLYGRPTADDLGGDAGDDLRQALLAAGFDPQQVVADDDPAIWWVEALAEVTGVSLFVDSDEDPRFAGGRLYQPLGQSGSVYVFELGALEACGGYQGVAGAQELPSGRAVQSNVLPLLEPCMELELEVIASSGEGCASVADSTATLNLLARAVDGEPLLTADVALDDPDNVIWNVNLPQDGQSYSTTLDLLALGEGRHRLFARLVDFNGEVRRVYVGLPVDFQAPDVRWLAPTSGALVCGSSTGEMHVSGEDEGFGFTWSATLGSGGSGIDVADGRVDAPASATDPVTLTFDQLTEPVLAGLQGDFIARVTALDDAGNAACQEISFQVDSLVDGQLAAQPSLISPNGDGIVDRSEILLTVVEASTVDVAVYAVALQTVGDVQVWMPTGSPLRTLATGALVDPGTSPSAQWSWDGLVDGGSVAPDATYAVVADLRDGCGNTARRMAFVEVDSTPPQTALSLPTDGAVLDQLTIDVIGTAADEHLRSWRLEVGAGASPTVFSPIAVGSQVRLNEVLTTWNAAGLDGVFTLRLRAEDEVGLSSEVLRTVELTGGVGLVSSLEADPTIFAPGAGSGADRTAIRSSLQASATVDLEILDAGGAVVRTLAAAEPRTLGTSLDVWDGRDDGGVLVADGDYRARLRATAGPTTQTESVAVVTDRTPPTLTLSQPGGSFAAPDMVVIGSILDAHLASYRVEVQVNGSWQLLSSGSSCQSGAVLGTLALGGVDLGGEPVILRLMASDEAGNDSELIRELQLDGSPPEVLLLAPAADALVSSASGPVAVQALVSEENGGSWSLEAGPGATPASFAVVASGSGLPASAPQSLAGWNTSALADGLWTLRLTVVDGAGQSASDSVTVTVDETPPTVAVTQPSAGGFATGTTEILGTAADDHLERYDVLVAPQAGGAFSRIAVRTVPVTSGLLLDWHALPPDGDYTLRVLAVDLAGHQRQVDVPLTVDTVPPSRPDGLQVTVPLGAPHADLTWNGVTDLDLDGYRVYRDGQPLAGPLPATSYRDLLPPEGLRTYAVVAVDRAAQESQPSDAEEVLIDRSPPAVNIQSPRDGGRVAGVVEVVGTAHSADDFGEWRLLAGLDGAPPSLVHRSTVSTQSDLLATWDATLGGLASDGDLLLLRLEAEDVRGNEAAQDVRVTLDQSPPARPTGLAASASGSDVTLTWDANAEPDLAGYLLYRDGRSLFGDADDPADAARNVTSWLDASVPDGDHSYVLVAVDLAGLVSPPSDPAEVSLDERAPHAAFVEPEDGHKTDGLTDVLLSLEDGDVDTVLVEFQADGAASWTPVATVSGEPWQTTWDPSALVYGLYHLRATATDLGGQTDPAPDQVSVSFQDLQPPPAVTSPSATVDGDQVTLTWPAVSAADLAGYHVERREDVADSDFLRLTTTPTMATGYVDSGVPDGRHLYRVVAVDEWANEANPSPAASATVYLPVFDSVDSPTSVFTTTVTGSAISADGPVSGQVQAEIEGPSGVTALPAVTTVGGAFTLAGVPLEAGTNTLRAAVLDAGGHRSRVAETQILAGNVPSRPTGLSPTVTGNRVDLTWNANPEPDILGYFVFVDGVLDTAPDQLPWSLMTADASSAESFYPASDALRSAGYWAPVVDTNQPVAGQWWQATWDDPALATGVFVEWWSYWYRALDYDVMVTLDGTRWEIAVEVRGNDESDVDHAFPQAKPIRGIRLLIHTMDSLPTDNRPLRLDTVEVNLLSPQPNLDWTDLYLDDGLHTLAVTAVSELGFESAPSEVQVAVGDVDPPTPVVLSAVATGSDVQLTWTPSPSPDVLFHQIRRDGETIGAVVADATSYDDLGVANGNHVYVVRTYDNVLNVADSNEASVLVDVPPPPAPLALTLDVPAEGGVLDLAWTSPAQPVAGFRVYRSPVSGGPWQAVSDDLGPTTTSFRDATVTNGVEYFYVARSVDTLGNESPSSNEVSGVPEDTLAPATSIFVPTVPGSVYVTDSTLLDRLAGLTSPGAEVEVFRDGELVAITTADSAAEPGSEAVHWAAGANDVGAPYLSPDGRWLWLTYWSTWNDQQRLYDFATDTLSPISGINWPSHWMPDGERIVFSTNDWPNSRLSFYRPADGSTTFSGAELQWIDGVAPSPDGRLLAVLGDRDDTSGFHVYDLDTGLWTTPLELATWQVAEESLTWTGDGRYLTYLQRGDVMALDPLTGTTELLSDAGPSWGRVLDASPDGNSVAYVAAAGGDQHVFVHDFDTGTGRQVTSGNGLDYARARYTADGSALATIAWDGRLLRVDLASGEESLLYEYDSWWWDLDAAAGYLLVTDDGNYGRLAEAGRFEVENLLLDVGDNLFTARGTDSAGNVGAYSESITVRLEASSLPDLRIVAGDLVMLPTFPIEGQIARLTVTVRNVGGVPAEASQLRWELVHEDGATVVGGPVAMPELGAGEAMDVAVDLDLDAGRYVLGATADSDGVVAESDETNNRAEIEVVALVDAGPAIYVDTDRPTYGSGDDVRISLELVNGGPTVEGDVVVRVEDVAGFLVEDLGVVGQANLDLGERATLQAVWNTGDVFAGDYRVVAELRVPGGGAAGDVLASGSRDFAISDGAVVSLEVTAGAAAFPAGAEVVLNVGAGYLSGNSVLEDSVLRWTVAPTGGAVLDTADVEMADLLPGDVVAVPLAWSSAGAPTGDYETVVTWLADDGSTLATATTSFALSAPAGGLAGSLDLALGQPPVGVDQVIAYSVQSLAGAGAASQPIRLRTSHPSGGLVDELLTTVDLSAASFQDQGSHVLATGGLVLASYVVRLEAEVDVGGTPTWVLLASVSFDTTDGTPPQTAIVHPQTDGYLGLGQSFEVTSLDALSSVAAVEVSIDGGAWLPATLTEPSSGLWSRPPADLPEGPHVLNARAVDAWANVAAAGPVPFVADFTPPAITITGVEEGWRVRRAGAAGHHHRRAASRQRADPAQRRAVRQRHHRQRRGGLLPVGGGHRRGAEPLHRRSALRHRLARPAAAARREDGGAGGRRRRHRVGDAGRHAGVHPDRVQRWPRRRDGPAAGRRAATGADAGARVGHDDGGKHHRNRSHHRRGGVLRHRRDRHHQLPRGHRPDLPGTRHPRQPGRGVVCGAGSDAVRRSGSAGHVRCDRDRGHPGAAAARARAGAHQDRQPGDRRGRRQ